MEMAKVMSEINKLEKIMKAVDSNDPIPDEYRHYISMLLHDRYGELLCAEVDIKKIV